MKIFVAGRSGCEPEAKAEAEDVVQPECGHELEVRQLTCGTAGLG